MKYLLWILLLFAAAVALVTASHHPAYVLLVYPPYRIELSLTLFIVLLMLAFIFGYGLLRLMFAVVQLPAYVRRFRLERAQGKARELLDDALGAFFEGHYAAAEKASARAMGLGDTSRGAKAMECTRKSSRPNFRPASFINASIWPSSPTSHAEADAPGRVCTNSSTFSRNRSF